VRLSHNVIKTFAVRANKMAFKYTWRLRNNRNEEPEECTLKQTSSKGWNSVMAVEEPYHRAASA